MFETFMNYYENLNIIINNNENKNQVAVIVEPRNHEYLIPIIKQVMSKIGDRWNLQIFGSSMNERIIKEKIKGNYKFINMQIDDLISPATYSLLLQSSQFWNQIKEEHILIFQTDSFVLNINNDYKIPTKYGFLGAKYDFGLFIDNKHVDTVEPILNSRSMNGGFSYRQKSVMLECINKVSYADIIEYRKINNMTNLTIENHFIIPEDVFFCNALVILGYDYPTGFAGEINFCIDHFLWYSHKSLYTNPLTVFGIHPFNKFKKEDLDYICGELLKKDAINY